MASEALTTDGLAPWVREYCGWVVRNPTSDRVARLTEAWSLSGCELTDGEVRGLEQLSGFKALQEELLSLDVLEAKAVFQGQSSKMARDFFAMADLAKSAGDYDKWAKFGIPFLNRVWAEKSEGAVVQTQVIVNLGGFAAKQGELTEVVIEEKGVD